MQLEQEAEEEKRAYQAKLEEGMRIKLQRDAWEERLSRRE